MLTSTQALIAAILISISVTVSAGENSEDKVPISKEKGEEIIQSCLNDNTQSCYDYAFYAAKNLNNLATYRLALKRACALKHLDACEQLEKDDREGSEIRNKCERGDVDACIFI